jgi:hypothetical protein
MNRNQTESAPAGEDHRVQSVHEIFRPQGVDTVCARSTAAHIHSSDRALLRQDNRTACVVMAIGDLSDPKLLNSLRHSLLRL